MKTIAAAALLSVLAGSASAQLTVTGSAGAGFQAFPSVLNNYGAAVRPYWDQKSMDGGNRNVGNYLSGTYTAPLPAGSSASPGITPRWWGRTSTTDDVATMDTSLGFNLAGGGAVSSTLRLEVAGNASNNEIGWFNLGDAVGSEVLHPLFLGAASPTSSVQFTPSASFGLYLKASASTVFFSQSARNRGGQAVDKTTQHFAVFGANLTPGSELYYIGAEDLTRGATGIEGVGDYNDVVITLGSGLVPTPGAAGVLALGGAAALRRRRV